MKMQNRDGAIQAEPLQALAVVPAGTRFAGRLFL
jgi:hypothetical protein